MDGMQRDGITSWMLSKNGIAVPVERHPYIVKDNLELSLFWQNGCIGMEMILHINVLR